MQFTKEGEGSVEDAAIVGACNDGVLDAISEDGLESIAFRLAGFVQMKIVGGAEKDRRFFGRPGFDAQRAAEHGAHPTQQFVPGAEISGESPETARTAGMVLR